MKREYYDDLIEIYSELEKKLGDLTKVKCSDLMDYPKSVKLYRLILGYSLEDFASQCDMDSSVLTKIERSKKLEYNNAKKIYEVINRLMKNNKIEKISIDILSKNYLIYEIIKSKDLDTLAKYQTRYHFIGMKSDRFWGVIYAILFINIVIFSAFTSLPMKIFFSSLSLILIIYITFLMKQYFLWDNDIISNFICLLLKDSYPKSNNEIKKIIRVLSSRLDDNVVQYIYPCWYFNSIRKELSDVINDNIYYNINDTNKDIILTYFERINIFLSSYSAEEYEKIKILINDIRNNLNKAKHTEPDRKDIIHILTTGVISPIFYGVKNITDILNKTLSYWILGLIVGAITYYLTLNLEFTGLILAFLGSIFIIHSSMSNKTS